MFVCLLQRGALDLIRIRKAVASGGVKTWHVTGPVLVPLPGAIGVFVSVHEGQ